MARVNGKTAEAADGMSLADFLEREGYRADRVAVECNGSIIPKSRYGDTIIGAGDSFEIVGFVGGG